MGNGEESYELRGGIFTVDGADGRGFFTEENEGNEKIPGHESHELPRTGFTTEARRARRKAGFWDFGLFQTANGRGLTRRNLNMRGAETRTIWFLKKDPRVIGFHWKVRKASSLLFCGTLRGVERLIARPRH